MAPRTSVTFAKRQKERARQEKQQAKQERKLQRRLEKREAPQAFESGEPGHSEPLSDNAGAATETGPTERKHR